MTKMIKMSLIAAVAVTGMTSAASAQNLEDAIKGVDVSGYVDYRLENRSYEATPASNFNVNEYAVRVNLKSKVNDQVTANLSVGFDEVQTDNTNSGGSSVTIAQDANPSLNVVNAYFTANLGSTVVMAGKQNIPSVFVDKVDTVKTGAGVVVLQPVNNNLTVAAAHFINNNIATVYALASTPATDTKTSEFIAMGNVANVDYALHYNYTDLGGIHGGTTTDHTFAKLGTKIQGVALTAKYAHGSTSSVDATTWADASVAQLIASGKIGDVTLTGAYAKADKVKGSNGAQSDVALDADNDADVHLKVWQASTQTIANKGDVMALTVAMPILNNVTASLTYAAAKDKGVGTAHDTDYTETLAQLTYAMSKNFTIHARYSMLTKDNTGNGDVDTNYSRLAIKYTF